MKRKTNKRSTKKRLIKSGKHLIALMKQKRAKAQLTNIRNEKEDITIKPLETKK